MISLWYKFLVSWTDQDSSKSFCSAVEKVIASNGNLSAFSFLK